MSDKLMETEAGGEGGQYEGDLGFEHSHKKSGGQMSHPQTTDDPSATSDAAQSRNERTERTMENIRYGQTISEGGMGGMTENTTGKAAQEGYGRIQDDSKADTDKQAVDSRQSAGYGGDRDMNREVGA